MAANGIILINKPPNQTSRRTTDRVSRILKEKKAGHLGTLDPIATGVLPIALGRATRIIRFLEHDDKVYRGTIRFGSATDTQDSTGKVLFEGDATSLDPAAITAAVATLLGETFQVPPMHSAIKKDGTPLYKLARQGIEVHREPRKVKIFSVLVESIMMPDVVVRVRCAPGTYLRTIAHDLGRRLGCGAHLASLTRLWSGPFGLENTVDLEDLSPENANQHLIPLHLCLPHFPAVTLDKSQAATIRDGVSVVAPDNGDEFRPGLRYRLLHQDKLLAVACGIEHGKQVLLRPLRVFG